MGSEALWPAIVQPCDIALIPNMIWKATLPVDFLRTDKFDIKEEKILFFAYFAGKGYRTVLENINNIRLR